MKYTSYIAIISVSVLLTACQQTPPSTPDSTPPAPTAAPTATTTPMAAPAADTTTPPAAAPAPAADSTSASASAPASPGEIIINNDDSTSFKSQGSWSQASGGDDYKDSTLYAGATSASDPANTATWTPDIKNAGMYDVYEWHGDDPNTDHATNEPFTVKSADGTKTILVNLRTNTGKWNLLGTFNFSAGTDGNVMVSSSGTDGNVLANAVKFVPHQ